MDETHIFNLPSDVIVDIFGLVQRQDLINLTTVCKLFNNIISNSPRLLYKLPVFLNKFTSRNWVGSRKYNNVYLSDEKFKSRLYILEFLADSIVKFRIIDTLGYRVRRQEFDIDSLIELLHKMPKLTRLSLALLYDSQIKTYANKSKLTLNLDLDFLDVLLHQDLFPLFNYCNVKRFEVSYALHSNALFAEFLKRQTNLHELRISSIDLFKDNTLTNMDFRLKKLRFDPGTEDNVENEIKFLMQFKESLEWVELYFCGEEYLRILPYFEKLKTLKSYHMYEEEELSDLVLPSIEKLMVSGLIPSKATQLFPNLKHLTIKNSTGLVKIEQFTKLESITTYKRIRIDISRSSAKRLTIIHYVSEIPPFDYEDHSFEEIFVVKSTTTDPKWLKKFIDGGHGANLKIFSVTQGEEACFELI